MWDLRDLNDIKLLDYNTPLESHFDLKYLRELLDTCRDRDMVSQVTDTGANFGADVALQIYFATHLTTLAPGYELVSKELKRLAGAGYLEFGSYFGFLPCRFIRVMIPNTAIGSSRSTVSTASTGRNANDPIGNGTRVGEAKKTGAVDGESPIRFAPPTARATSPLPSQQLPHAASSPTPRTPEPAPKPVARTAHLCMPPPPS